MKVIKRDGKAVDYNREKIQTAIEKANNEVSDMQKISKEEIKEITKYIEDLNKKRILVEDIQDIIEQQLMDRKKFELAKTYMIYRYNRALVRKQNTTDESILGLIKNRNRQLEGEDSNKNAVLASTQRDYIAGEVSQDLSKRMLLPEKIAKAHEEGILYFHNMDYFLQPIFNSSLINIGDILENGTVMNGKLIESPRSFQTACKIMTQIIIAVASNQYGEQSIDVSHLGKYIRRSYENFKKEIEEEFKKNLTKEIMEKIVAQKMEKEIFAGVQTIQYQINTLMTANGRVPSVTLFLNLKKEDPYIKENAMLIEEILKQNYEGMKNEEGVYVTPDAPKLIYVIDEHNGLKGGEYDYLTELALKCTLKRLHPAYISAKKMRENYEGNVFSPVKSHFLTPWKDENGNYKFEGRFNQGIVSINLPQIAIVADGDEEKFWDLLNERLELCKEALMCKHYALLGTMANISPLHWNYGVISRMGLSEKIDALLKGGYSTISLGYIGLYETTKLVKGVSHTKPEGYSFSIKLMKHLKNTIERWKKETGLGFSLCGIQSKKLGYHFAKIDREEYGEIKDITDKGYYTNSYHVDTREEIELKKRLKFESEYEKLSLGGAISYIQISDSEEELKDLIKFVYDNIQYVEFI